MRLRINFNDEITALEQAEPARIANEGVSALVEFVDSELASLLETEGLEEQSVTAVNEARDAFMAGTPATIENPVAGLQASFDDLTSALNTALATAPEPEIDGPAKNIVPEGPPEEIPMKSAASTGEQPPESADATTFDFDQFIANLVESFVSKLQELEASLTDVQVLPEISEPKGNGVAYDKFMAIYNQLRTPESEIPVDAVL